MYNKIQRALRWFCSNLIKHSFEAMGCFKAQDNASQSDAGGVGCLF